jgi:hypothetical protein
MPVLVSVANLGDAELASDVRAAIEHALGDQPGDWRVALSARRQMMVGS